MKEISKNLLALREKRRIDKENGVKYWLLKTPQAIEKSKISRDRYNENSRLKRAKTPEQLAKNEATRQLKIKLKAERQNPTIDTKEKHRLAAKKRKHDAYIKLPKPEKVFKTEAEKMEIRKRNDANRYKAKNPTRNMQPTKLKTMGKVPKPRIQLKITNNATTGLISFKLDSKTTIFLKPGQDIEKVKAKYANRRG